MSKYKSKRVEIDGVTFDSKAEAAYYQQLKLLKRGKKITDFVLQPRFTLQESFVDSSGKKQRPITYSADFKIMHLDGSVEVVDVKSSATKTQQYLIRKKLFLHKFPEYKFTEAIK